MKLQTALYFSLASLATAFTIPPQLWLSSQSKHHDATPAPQRIPTVEESAAMARRMLRYETIGTLSTKYPHDANTVAPDDVSGAPFGLMDYFADCEPNTGNPSLLGMTVSTSFRNAAAGSNITLSIRWHKPGAAPYSAMEMPRFALIGQVERMNLGIVDTLRMAECYGKTHPDAVVWMPGNRIHESYWMRLVVKEVYWLGGFGNQAYIGWIPLETWQGVTEKEIQDARLPGEESQSLWSRFWGSLEL